MAVLVTLASAGQVTVARHVSSCWRLIMKVMKVPWTALLCFSLTALASVPAEALNSAGTPVLAKDIGFYCSATYATHGATLTWGNTNSNPCQGATGATKISTGMYSTSGTNI